jgi:hypothetical protein
VTLLYALTLRALSCHAHPGWRTTGSLPKFLALDDVSFNHPVEVGTLVEFDAHVSYARGPGHKTYGVSVAAYTSRPHEGSARSPKLTNRCVCRT